MDIASEAPQRRRRRNSLRSESIHDATDGVRTSKDDFEEDLADTIVDINRLVEHSTARGGEDLPSEIHLDLYDKETRLRYIHKMMMRDVPKAEMCKRLGISKHILERDTKELWSRLRDGARKLDVNELIGTSLATYNEVLSMALNHASNTGLPTPTRLAALRTVLSAKNDMARFLNLAGVFDTLVYKPNESKAQTDIGDLIRTTQAILDKDELAEVHEVTAEQRVSVERDLQEIRLF